MRSVRLVWIIILILIACTKDEIILPFDSNSKILFLSRRIEDSADWQIYLMNFDGGSQRKLTEKIVNCSKPVPSNDGSKIAFISYENGYYHLFKIDTSGNDLVLIAKNDEYCGCPSWSPDDSKLLFTQRTDFTDHKNDIFVMDITSNKETRLTFEGNNSCPSWFPNGMTIVYTSTISGIYRVYIMNPDGTNKKLLNPSDIPFSNPIVSPNEEKIIVTSRSWNGSQIFIMNSDGSDLKQLTFSVDPDYWDIGFPRQGNQNPSWSPSGEEIVYVTFERGDPDICLINADGSGKRRLTNTSSNDNNPCWSQDGNFILFNSNLNHKGYPDIYIMQSNGSRIRSLSNYYGDDIFPVVF